MIGHKHLDNAFDATTPYLESVEKALEEAHETVRVLTGIRGMLMRTVLGEEPPVGLKKAIQQAGSPIPPETKAEQ